MESLPSAGLETIMDNLESLLDEVPKQLSSWWLMRKLPHCAIENILIDSAHQYYANGSEFQFYNGKHHSRQLETSSLKLSNFMGNRLVVRDEDKPDALPLGLSKFIECPLVTELTTAIEIQEYPTSLEKLNFSISIEPKFLFTAPLSLRSLTLCINVQTMDWEALLRSMFRLLRLHSLKLVLKSITKWLPYDFFRSLLGLAIERGMRRLVVSQ